MFSSLTLPHGYLELTLPTGLLSVRVGQSQEESKPLLGEDHTIIQSMEDNCSHLPLMPKMSPWFSFFSGAPSTLHVSP